jgi:hypothetical protein
MGYVKTMTLEVTALLGDPRIRNSPKGRFGPADLIAIEKMHSALSSLKAQGLFSPPA